MTQLHEFEIITKYFFRPVKNTAQISLGIGDDAALMTVPPGYELACTVDTLVEGTHFPANSEAKDIGFKSLAVSLSDLAAMGAEPLTALLALTLPHADENWLEQFRSGFFSLAERYQVELIGGNITQGPLTINTVAYGCAPAGKALRRSGAKPGDLIYVTGALGDAGLALQQIQQGAILPPSLHQRFFQPEPRIKAGLALREIATAAIDISDGLAADLTKLLTASGVGGSIQTQNLPLSAIMHRLRNPEQANLLALTAGEDYELCFTSSRHNQDDVKKIFKDLDCELHFLGTVEPGSGLKIYQENGALLNLTKLGYQHF